MAKLGDELGRAQWVGLVDFEGDELSGAHGVEVPGRGACGQDISGAADDGVVRHDRQDGDIEAGDDFDDVGHRAMSREAVVGLGWLIECFPDRGRGLLGASVRRSEDSGWGFVLRI